MPIIYTNYSYNPMLIETAISILTDPIANMLTALLEYINFNLSQWQYKTNIWGGPYP